MLGCGGHRPVAEKLLPGVNPQRSGAVTFLLPAGWRHGLPRREDTTSLSLSRFLFVHLSLARPCCFAKLVLAGVRADLAPPLPCRMPWPVF